MTTVWANLFDLNIKIILLECIIVTSSWTGILSYSCKMQNSRLPRELAFSHSENSSACTVPKLLKMVRDWHSNTVKEQWNICRKSFQRWFGVETSQSCQRTAKQAKEKQPAIKKEEVKRSCAWKDEERMMQKSNHWACFLERPSLNNGFIVSCVWKGSTKIVLKWRDLQKLYMWFIVVIIGLKRSLSLVQGFRPRLKIQHLNLMFVDPCTIVQFLQWKTQQDAKVLSKFYYSLF